MHNTECVYSFVLIKKTMMQTTTKKHSEPTIQKKIKQPVRLYNPEGLDFRSQLRVKSIEATEAYTRIDFMYHAPSKYINGGWVQLDPGTYIQPVDSELKYGLIQAINIPLAPTRYHFIQAGELLAYTLIFPALPKNTTHIHIIEKDAPGTYFNFYNLDYAEWMTVPHPVDQMLSPN